jgi:hypothetical protein
MNIPYTYRIGWSKTGMNYYGVRYAKDCHPDEFWVTYFTSSEYVERYRTEYGEPNIIEIRRVFTTETRVTEAREWEHKVLKRLKVTLREDYLNKSHSKSVDTTDPEVRERWISVMKSEEHRDKMADIAVDLWKDEDYRSRNLAAQRAAHNLPGASAKKSATSKKALSSPTAKMKLSKSMSELWNDHQFKENNLKRLRGGSTHPSYSHIIYNFYHEDGTTEYCTSYTLRKKYPSVTQQGISKLTTGKSSSHKGWRIATL